jgi:hypothetical protein
MLTVTIDHPHFPDGAEFEIRGLGTLVNRVAKEITSEMAEAYERLTGQKVTELGGVLHVNDSAAPVAEPEATSEGGETT